MSRSPKNPADMNAAEERAAVRLRDALDPDATYVDDGARDRVRTSALERSTKAPAWRAVRRRQLTYSLVGAAALVAVALVAFLGAQSSRPSLSAAAVVKRAIAVMERLQVDPDAIVHDVVVETVTHYEPEAEDPAFRRQVTTARYESWRAVGGGLERLVQHETRYDGYETSTTSILSEGRITRVTTENGETTVADSSAAEGQMSAGHYRYAGPCEYCHVDHTSLGGDRVMRDKSKEWADGGKLYRWLLESDKLTLADTREFEGRTVYVLHNEKTSPGTYEGDTYPDERSVTEIFVEATTFRLLGSEMRSYRSAQGVDERLTDLRTLRIESSEILSRDDLPANFFSGEVGSATAVRTGGLSAEEVKGFTYQPIYWLGAHPSPKALLPTATSIDGIEPNTVLDAIIYVASPQDQLSASDNVSAFYSVFEGEPAPADAPSDFVPAMVVRRMIAVVTRRPSVHAAYVPGSLEPDPKSFRFVTRTIGPRKVTFRFRLRDGLSSDTVPTPAPADAYVFSGHAYVEFPDAVVELYDPSPSFASAPMEAPTESLTEADIERLVPLLELGN